jgi:branched-chain amino acid aminotransferase
MEVKKMPTAWINGNFVDEDDASVSIRDTGLLHAAGVFTTMRSYGGKVFRLDLHLARLRKSCEALFIPLQYRDEQLTAAVDEILQRNSLSDARLRLTVTRGAAEQDPIHGMKLSPTCFLTATELQPYPREYYERGMTALLLDEQKLNPYDMQAGHKTLNYFSRLAGLRAANQRGAGEALWFNVHNFLQSGSVSNVFIVRAGVLITPPTPEDLRGAKLAATVPYPKSNVLAGVVRQTILDIAEREGITIEIGAIDVNRVLGADEVFLTNSIMGVMPVCRLERKVIGADKPGEVTTKFAERYAMLVSGG